MKERKENTDAQPHYHCFCLPDLFLSVNHRSSEHYFTHCLSSKHLQSRRMLWTKEIIAYTSFRIP
jgi:hypothetical protein